MISKTPPRKCWIFTLGTATSVLTIKEVFSSLPHLFERYPELAQYKNAIYKKGGGSWDILSVQGCEPDEAEEVTIRYSLERAPLLLK